MSAGEVDIDGLLALLGGDAFLAKIWQRRWKHFERCFLPDDLSKLLALSDLDHAVLMGMSAPSLQVLTNGRAVDLPQTPSIAPAPDTDHLIKAFRSGNGFRVQHLENYLPAIASYCRLIEAEFGFPFRANCYVSPKDSRGLAPHYDSSEVFVVQVVGSKKWRIYGDYTNRLELPLYEARFNPAFQRPLGGPTELIMKEGDVLYMPRGTMHAAVTNQTASVHVTFAVLGMTWIDLIGRAIRRASSHHREMRELIPIGAVNPSKLALEASRILAQVHIEDEVSAFIDELKGQEASHKPSARLGNLEKLIREQSLEN